MSLDDIRLYLPKYLSEESTKILLKEISGFPKNSNGGFFTEKLNNKKVIFQGDGLEKLPVVNLPENLVKYKPALVLSNTCDIDLGNNRAFPSQIFYAPIFNLNKYKQRLIDKKIKNIFEIDQHIKNIKNQKLTQILFLPKGGQLKEDSFVFLDRINNCPNKIISRDNLEQERLFVLSDFGLYFFLLKLSIHLTRIQEKIDRHKGTIY